MVEDALKSRTLRSSSTTYPLRSTIFCWWREPSSQQKRYWSTSTVSYLCRQVIRRITGESTSLGEFVWSGNQVALYWESKTARKRENDAKQRGSDRTFQKPAGYDDGLSRMRMSILKGARKKYRSCEAAHISISGGLTRAERLFQMEDQASKAESAATAYIMASNFFQSYLRSDPTEGDSEELQLVSHKSSSGSRRGPDFCQWSRGGKPCSLIFALFTWTFEMANTPSLQSNLQQWRAISSPMLEELLEEKDGLRYSRST